jgi:hypothetical protein
MDFELNDLLMFGHVDWLNPVNPDEEHRKKTHTSTSIDALCFIFKRVIVIVPQSTNHSAGKKTSGTGKNKVNNNRGHNYKYMHLL